MSEHKSQTVQYFPHVALISLPDGCAPGKWEAAEYFAKAVSELREQFPHSQYRFVSFDHEENERFGGVKAWLAIADNEIDVTQSQASTARAGEAVIGESDYLRMTIPEFFTRERMRLASVEPANCFERIKNTWSSGMNENLRKAFPSVKSLTICTQYDYMKAARPGRGGIGRATTRKMAQVMAYFGMTFRED